MEEVNKSIDLLDKVYTQVTQYLSENSGVATDAVLRVTQLQAANRLLSNVVGVIVGVALLYTTYRLYNKFESIPDTYNNFDKRFSVQARMIVFGILGTITTFISTLCLSDLKYWFGVFEPKTLLVWQIMDKLVK